MNCVSQPEQRAVELVDLVDFKWLMAHEGHHVQVERLKTDAEYARDCLAKAAASPVDALRNVALRLACALLGPAPT